MGACSLMTKRRAWCLHRRIRCDREVLQDGQGRVVSLSEGGEGYHERWMLAFASLHRQCSPSCTHQQTLRCPPSTTVLQSPPPLLPYIPTSTHPHQSHPILPARERAQNLPMATSAHDTATGTRTNSHATTRPTLILTLLDIAAPYTSAPTTPAVTLHSPHALTMPAICRTCPTSSACSATSGAISASSCRESQMQASDLAASADAYDWGSSPMHSKSAGS